MEKFSPEDEAFREAVRGFLDVELTKDLRQAGRETTGVFTDWPTAKRWHQILYRKGWVAPSWPLEHGGTGWSIVQQYIFASELAASDAPKPAVMGLQMVGPIIMQYGTEAQKAHYLPRILSGEDFWCQGYSEPGAGSDLASLKTKAVSDGDDYIVSGSKIWTTHAQWANRMFCLVRTANDGKPQAGITFLLLDMNLPGITVKPIITLAGEHEVNQIFFDDVRVPKSGRLGAENGGWTVAKHLLQFERSVAHAAPMRAELARAIALSKEQRAEGKTLHDDPSWRIRLAELEISIEAYEGIELRVMQAASRGETPGPASSILKVMSSELSQKIAELAVEAAGYYGAPQRVLRNTNASGGYENATAAMSKYLNTRAMTIFGGTSEVQRNLIAKLVLGL